MCQRRRPAHAVRAYLTIFFPSPSSPLTVALVALAGIVSLLTLVTAVVMHYQVAATGANEDVRDLVDCWGEQPQLVSLLIMIPWRRSSRALLSQMSSPFSAVSSADGKQGRPMYSRMQERVRHAERAQCSVALTYVTCSSRRPSSLRIWK